MNKQAKHWIETLNLQAHPEGGYYRETYRAPLQVESAMHQGSRAAFTSIYYLLADRQFSAWHRVASDESWFFHSGTDLIIHCLKQDQNSHNHSIHSLRLGNIAGKFETTIPAGTWFAAEVAEPHDFALVSCVVAPGFEFADFELATCEQLHAAGYRQHAQWAWIETMLAKH